MKVCSFLIEMYSKMELREQHYVVICNVCFSLVKAMYKV